MQMYIGESFVGSGANAAHINIVMGPRDGPVGGAWASALASPSAGHLPFLAVLKPGFPTKPPVVFINKAALVPGNHETMTWGPAQAGVAKGVHECMRDGVLPAQAADEWCVIAAVWVNPAADDAEEVYRNNYESTRGAIVAAMRNTPALADLEVAAQSIGNPFFTPKQV